MSSLSRLGSTVARNTFIKNQRRMASATAATEPIQKLFVDKIREFKSSNQGLDEAHQKALIDEIARLKRVYRVEDESKLAKFDTKFASEVNVSLRDIDETKEIRRLVKSGEYQKRLAESSKPKSALLASIPEQVTEDMHLPPLNKPDILLLVDNTEPLPPLKIVGEIPDYEFVGSKMTPERLQDEMCVEFGPNMATIDDDKSPQRDLVNFPRIHQNLHAPPTRFHIVPESWFQFFYPKTGVTGPYAFATGLITFLFSKEWIVFEHEILTGLSSTIIFTYAVIKFGPRLSSYLNKEVDKDIGGWDEWQNGNIRSLNELQEHYKNELNQSNVIDNLYELRKQDVELQLEAEYRNRLKSIYDEAKRRLDYLIAKADSQRQIHHNNLINWVIGNAVTSISQKQENEVLDSCIDNLKKLASKNANVV